MIVTIQEFNADLNTKFNEGLMKTYDIGFLLKSLYEYYNRKQYVFTITHNTPKMQVNLLLLENVTIDKIKSINGYLQTCGYYIADVEVNETNNWIHYTDLIKMNDNDIYLLNVVIEPKFNIVKKLNTCYHVTSELNLDKILRIGLVPRSGNKLSYHPDRVYVTDNIESCERLISKLLESSAVYNRDEKGNKITRNKNCVILEITSDIAFYDDPNYADSYFTYENIAPKNIKLIKTVIHNDEQH